MPELKQLGDFYDPTKTGMAALNVMQNQQHIAMQQQQAAIQQQSMEQQGKHLEVQNLKAALQSANPMESYPLYARLMEMNGQAPPGVNEYYANTDMYNKLISATPGTPEHADAMDKWSRTSEGSRKIVEGENNTSRARQGGAILLARAGLPSDPNTAELMRQSGPMQNQVTDALALSPLQQERAKAVQAQNQEHERLQANVNAQLNTLVPASKAAELAINRATPFVMQNDEIERDYQKNIRGMGTAKAQQVRYERMAVNPELMEFDSRRRDSIPKLEQALRELEDQQAQLQSRAELVARGVQPLGEGESLEILAGNIDNHVHQVNYMRAQRDFAKKPTPDNLNALRNVKQGMDSTISSLSEKTRASRESLDIRRAGIDEKVFMDRYKIDREMKVGQAQADWMEAGGKVGDLPKIARKYNVKVDEIRDASKDPNRPTSTNEVNVHMPKTTEEAGKFAMMDNAVKSIDQVSQAITKSDGSIDKAKVFASYFNIPFTEGRNIRSLTQDAISAKLRAETGAAANKDEVQGIADRFDLSPFDNEDVQKDKLRRLRRFLNETRVIRDPTGKIREVAAGENAPEPKSKAQPAPAQKGTLSAKEQAELEALRKKYGR